MNQIDFSKTGGFPLETETLNEMQENTNLLQAFGDLVGSKCIIKGCNLTGSTVSDGVIYWNGEVLKFIGGLVESKIVIIENKTSVPFEDGELKEVYIERYATFGTGVGDAPWADFVRAKTLIALENLIQEKATNQDLQAVSDRLLTAELKLAGIEEGAEVNVQSDYAESNTSKDAYIKNKPNNTAFLMKGSYNIGDVTANDVQKTISFSSVGTSNYLVVGSIVSQGGDFNNDNDVIWSIRSKTTTSFKLLMRDMGGVVQNIKFDYALIPL